jgi:hypothetical protein
LSLSFGAIVLPPSTNLPSLIAEPLSELAPHAVEWLWPGRLALGKLAMLDGDPSQGKSLVALDLCARLSIAQPMPDGSPGPGLASSLILNAEDAGADTVLPRLKAMGADLHRVFHVRREDDSWDHVCFPDHTSALDQLLAQTGARLVVIDPVMAYLDRSVAGNSDQGVRRALSPLAQLAQRRGCVILLVRHLNKRGGSCALYRGGGSIGLLAACRSGWLIAEDPSVPGRHVLAQVKNNLAPPQPSLAYEVRSSEGVPPTVCWLGTSPWRADELLSAASHRSPVQPRERAYVFLASFLQDGPRTSREVWSAAQAEGLAERTLLRAKQDLSIRSQSVWHEKVQHSYWLLPGQTLPGDETDLEEWLGPLRKMYPPLTPLDDL